MAEGHSIPKISASSRVRVKKEKDCDFRDGHSHQFKFQFKGKQEKYTINCDRPRTVLEALKTHDMYMEKENSDEKIVISFFIEERKVAIATHFPCHLIKDDDLLVIASASDKVEEVQHEAISSQDDYVTFFIQKEGGNKTRTKELFRSSAVKHCDYLCVCAEMGMTVEEALKRDGRFIDNLGNFTLSDKKDENCHTVCSQLVDSLDGRYLQICLPLGKRAKSKVPYKNRESENQQANQKATHDSPNSEVKSEAKTISDVVKRRRWRVSDNDAEILSLLRKQFPALKKQMQSRFPGDSFKKALELRKEDFGKIQQLFSEVYRVKQLFEQGRSVCKVIVGNLCQGTGFILFDNFILTSGHLFKDCFVPQEGTFQLTTDVNAEFNYENPNGSDRCLVTVKQTILDFSFNKSGCELDYAILELDTQTVRWPGASQTEEKSSTELPPGLLKRCGPVPVNGEACIIGHPAGDVKKMDPTCIIEKERREEAANSHLEPYKDMPFTLFSIKQLVQNQGIQDIMQGGDKADKVVAYNTFMYHGASGSPVFDGGCRVFGLHTAGFVYGFPKNSKSVIEFAHPLIYIFKNFVMELKKSQNYKLLERVKKEAEGNQYLGVVWQDLSSDEMPMDTS